MRFYPFIIPNWATNLFPNLVWRLPNTQKVIYLTFDDGPHPEVTKWVLSELKLYNAKATFFVVGQNAQKYSAMLSDISSEGHGLGNHTFNHISGYSFSNRAYLDNVKKCQLITKTNLFRPPYGRIKPSQGKMLGKHFRVIMWNQLSGDFDKKLKVQRSLSSLKQRAKSGNIVVFHDSVKAFENLKVLLPSFLAFLKENNFQCKVIPNHELSLD